METKSEISQRREEQHILDEIDLQEELKDIFRSISSRISVDKIHWIQTHYGLPPNIITGTAHLNRGRARQCWL